jgi:hypothetical protein
VAIPTIDALENVLKRIEDLQDQCSRGLVRTQELNSLLTDLDRAVERLLPPDSSEFRIFDKRRRERTDVLKVTLSGYVDPTDCTNLDYRAETLRLVIDEYSPGFLRGEARNKTQYFFPAGDAYRGRKIIYQILKGARTNVAIVDEFLDADVFDYVELLDPAISVQMITGSRIRLFPKLLHALQGIRPNTEAREVSDCHDRFLILDSKEVWHMGASLNGVGKKAFMINKVTDPAELQSFLTNFSAWWGKGTPI